MLKKFTEKQRRQLAEALEKAKEEVFYEIVTCGESTLRIASVAFKVRGTVPYLQNRFGPKRPYTASPNTHGKAGTATRF